MDSIILCGNSLNKYWSICDNIKNKKGNIIDDFLLIVDHSAGIEWIIYASSALIDFFYLTYTQNICLKIVIDLKSYLIKCPNHKIPHITS
jgi:hypothetical protein